MSYVVFRHTDLGEIYWTGKWTEIGEPASTSKVVNANKFESARLAYSTAGATRKLDHWKVGKRI